MKAKALPEQSVLIQCLDYDPGTGLLTWKHRPEHTFATRAGRSPSHMANAWNAAWAGKPAFTAVAKNGYLKGAFNEENFYAHRIIYKMIHGLEPTDIDHEDGNRQNNRLANLVTKDRSNNLKNRRLSKNNTSGFHGVSFSHRHKLWLASIYEQGRSVHLGWFKEKEDAIAARAKAEVLYGYHPNHGKR